MLLFVHLAHDLIRSLSFCGCLLCTYVYHPIIENNNATETNEEIDSPVFL